MPSPLRVQMLPLMVSGPERILGIGEIAVSVAKCAHGYARERVHGVDRVKLPQRVVGSERVAEPLLMLHAVVHRFGVACTRQGGTRADNGHNAADGISALRVGIGCARVDAVGTVKGDGLFRHVCVCGSFAVRCSVTGHVRVIRSPQQFTLKTAPGIKMVFLQLKKTVSRRVGTSVSRLTICPTYN